MPPTPLLVKIAPDLTDHAVAEVLQVCADHRVAGVIATNTTLGRGGLDPADVRVGDEEAGGLSGRPLTLRARAVGAGAGWVAGVAPAGGGDGPVTVKVGTLELA